MADTYAVLSGIGVTWCLLSTGFMFAMMEIKQKEIAILEDIRNNLAKRPSES